MSILNGLMGGNKGGCGILGGDDDGCLNTIIVIVLVFLFIRCCCGK